MIKRIKLYFTMKKLERQMKYELLSHLYLFVSEKENYIKFLHSVVTEVDYKNFHRDLINRIAELVHEDSKKDAEEKVSE